MQLKKNKYTDQEKEILLKNPNILAVNDTNIKYCPKFKLKAVKEHENGKLPMQIFIDAQIDIKILGPANPTKCLVRWNKTYREKGEKGILENQRAKKSKSVTKELTIEEQFENAKVRIAYLEEENDFLKKLKALEGGNA